jgi:hypothetical protein
VTWDEIRLLVIHPKTGEPITKKTLSRHFKRELAAGGAALKQLIASKYFQALENGESWAVRMGMRNKYNWIVEGAAVVAPEVRGVPLKDETLQISFILPMPKPQDQPIDVTPSPPIDPAQQRLPPPRGQVVETPFGRWRTNEPQDWMK